MFIGTKTHLTESKHFNPDPQPVNEQRVLLEEFYYQPWEENMGRLMVLLVVMAVSSHLMSCGSPDCSRLYWITASLHKVFKLGLKSRMYRSEWSMRLNSSPIPCSGHGLVPPNRMMRSPTIQQHCRLLGHGPLPFGSTFFQKNASGLNFQRSLKCRSRRAL